MFKHLNESPDQIKVNDVTYKMNTSRAYPFEVIINTKTKKIIDVLISPTVGYHSDDIITNGPMTGESGSIVSYENPDFTYDCTWKKVYPGRIYTDQKVITFWVYPSQTELYTIINIMEQKLDLKILNNNYFIEIYDSASMGTKLYHNNYNRNEKSKLIEIEQYVTSDNPSEHELLAHLDTKHKHKVPAGYGSKNPKYQSRRQWQMASVTDESNNEIVFPKLLEDSVLNNFKKAEKHIKKDIKKTGLNKKLLTTIRDSQNKLINVYTVNGDYVRDSDPGLNFDQFADGGHHYVDSYPEYKRNIPENEIWIDDVFEFKLNDLRALLLHEYVERNLMKYKKWSYSNAHEYANKKESEYRKRIKNKKEV